MSGVMLGSEGYDRLGSIGFGVRSSSWRMGESSADLADDFDDDALDVLLPPPEFIRQPSPASSLADTAERVSSTLRRMFAALLTPAAIARMRVLVLEDEVFDHELSLADLASVRGKAARKARDRVRVQLAKARRDLFRERQRQGLVR